MKKQLFTLLILSTTLVGRGQNLVPNGDFEQYSPCPNSLGNLYASFWINPTTGSPDYFNQCAAQSTGVSVPSNIQGYQLAHSGGAYCGVDIFTQPPFVPDYRENIEVQLTTTLVANTCYHFEMYVSRANNCQYATDDLGAYFSNTIITGIPNWNPLPFTPQINNATGLLADTANWILVSGDFMAAGGENYLIIGNFKSDSNTTYQQVNPGATNAFTYYYYDDVSLVATPCTGINEFGVSNSVFEVYPNPAGDELHIQSSKFKVGDEIKIYDVEGRKVLQSIINNQSSIINIQSLKNGMYFIEINNVRKKFIKQ